MTRPALLLAVLIGLHLGAQLLVIGHVVPAILVLPLVAVTAFEVAYRSAARRSRRHLRR